jgi:hypothetical protein
VAFPQSLVRSVRSRDRRGAGELRAAAAAWLAYLRGQVTRGLCEGRSGAHLDGLGLLGHHQVEQFIHVKEAVLALCVR